MADDSVDQAPGTARPAKRPKRPKKPGKTTINIERCKGCGFCVAFCPGRVLRLSKYFNRKGYHYPEVVDLAVCRGCDLCGMLCPDFAIHGARRGK